MNVVCRAHHFYDIFHTTTTAGMNKFSIKDHLCAPQCTILVHISPQSVSEVAAKIQLVIVKLQPQIYDPLKIPVY